jgi:uncharacterized protein YsxB (DUF464 family)
MLRAEFEQSNQGFQSVKISGHAGFAGAGEDIVCAAVTSAFQLVANGITEIVQDSADIRISGDTAGIRLPAAPSKAAEAFLAALHLHLALLREQYPEHIMIIISEV